MAQCLATTAVRSGLTRLRFCKNLQLCDSDIKSWHLLFMIYCGFMIYSETLPAIKLYNSGEVSCLTLTHIINSWPGIQERSKESDAQTLF